MTPFTTDPPLERRRLLAATVWAALLASPYRAIAAEFPDISWDDLVPSGWDPMRAFPREGAGLSDSDPRSVRLLEKMREIWDNAPTVPAMAGRQVRLPGYLVPLDEAKDGIREFLLVPYFGACIHTPPPPANQIVHVRSQAPIKGFRTMDAIWVSGRLELARNASNMGVSGYAMIASKVAAYKAGGRTP